MFSLKKISPCKVGKMEKSWREHSHHLLEQSMWGVGRIGNIGTEHFPMKTEKSMERL